MQNILPGEKNGKAQIITGNKFHKESRISVARRLNYLNDKTLLKIDEQQVWLLEVIVIPLT